MPPPRWLWTSMTGKAGWGDLGRLVTSIGRGCQSRSFNSRISLLSWANAGLGAVRAVGMATASSHRADRRMGVPLIDRSSAAGSPRPGPGSHSASAKPAGPSSLREPDRAGPRRRQISPSWTTSPQQCSDRSEVPETDQSPLVPPPSNSQGAYLSMASLIKIGSLFLNLDQVLRVNDLFDQVHGRTQLVIHFGSGGGRLDARGPRRPATCAGLWLNSVATESPAPAADPESDGLFDAAARYFPPAQRLRGTARATGGCRP